MSYKISSEQLIRKIEKTNINDENVLLLLKEAKKVNPFPQNNAVPVIIRFLKSKSGLVRYNALSLLVLIWGQYQIEDVCAEMADHDPDGDVRNMAIACVGCINSNKPKRKTIIWLIDFIKSTNEDIFLKHSAYKSLLDVIGVPSSRWPHLSSVPEEFEKQVDWSLIKILE